MTAIQLYLPGVEMEDVGSNQPCETPNAKFALFVRPPFVLLLVLTTLHSLSYLSPVALRNFVYIPAKSGIIHRLDSDNNDAQTYLQHSDGHVAMPSSSSS